VAATLGEQATPLEKDEWEWESAAIPAHFPLAHKRTSPTRHPKPPQGSQSQRTFFGPLELLKTSPKHFALARRDELHYPMPLNDLCFTTASEAKIDFELLIEKEITEHLVLINTQWRRPLIELPQHISNPNAISNLHGLNYSLNNASVTNLRNDH
jgi:hypothetical protein